MKQILFASLTRVSLFSIYLTCLFLHACFGVVGRLLVSRDRRKKATTADEYRVLVIGTFYTRNWCIAHLTPVARAHNTHEVIAVVDGPTQPIDKVRYSYPPAWLVRVFGRALAKFCWALRIALRQRPEIVMGYHLLPGAMSALLVARLIGSRSIYQMTAGPVELIGGGAATENFFLKNLRTNSRVGEYLANAVCSRFDLVVVRGRTACRFVTERHLAHRVRIVPGSINPSQLTNGGVSRPYDVVTVCRMVPIKQPAQMLQVLGLLKDHVPSFRAVMMGDGPSLPSLKDLAFELGIAENVEFRGHVENVASVLSECKTFLLTSRSEGLSIAMAEAMAAGVVPIVADVGDLGDLVQHGETGWLVEPGAIGEYASRIRQTITRPQLWARLSRAAQAASISHTAVDHVADRWARTFAALLDNEARLPPLERRSMPRIAGRLWSRRRIWEAIPPSAKHLLAPMADTIPTERWLGRGFRETLAFLAEADRWSADEAGAYQLANLRRICRLAYERSVYYRKAMERIGFEPGDLRSLEDIKSLPIISRDTVAAQLETMCVIDPDSPSIDTVSTGGTSGAPLRFYIDVDRSETEYAHLVGGWQRAGYRMRFAQAVLRGLIVPDGPSGLRYMYDSILRRHYYSVFHMTDEYMRRYLEHISTIGPCYLLAYPSSVSTLVRFIERSGLAAPDNILGVLAGSEIVYPDDRARVERVLGVRCFSWYGHSEKLVFAAECEHCDDYHVSPTYGYFELLDDTGRPVTEPGQRGEIVGTGFINTVMPFIRYRTGDFATYVADRCGACGRAHPLIRDIRGHRTQEVLLAADGSQIPWTALNMHDDTFDCVRQFQFRQDVPGKAVLRVVPAPGFDETSRRRILRNLGAKLDGRLEFEIACVESIPLTRSGKSTYVEQRLDIENSVLTGATM